MKYIHLIIITILMPVYNNLYGQENIKSNDSVSVSDEISIIKDSFTGKDSSSIALIPPIVPVTTDHSFGTYGLMYGMTPFSHSYANWSLHKGFNASIGMSVTFSPSKYMPSGAGFGQDVSFMYAVPVNKRLSLAAGLYATNFNWGWMDYRNVGIAATAAFKVNDVVTLYGYGNKSIMPQRSPMYYPITNFAPDKLGGMVNFKIGESSSISIGVEGIKGGYPSSINRKPN